MKDTWNYPCWQCHDDGPGATRNTHGNVWIQPTQPFTSAITCLFSVLIRDGWTAVNAIYQGIFAIGIPGVPGGDGINIWMQDTDTNPYVGVRSYDNSGAVVRYNYKLGDEDGATWLAGDKWYNIGVSVGSTGLQYVVNGSTTPMVTELTNTPGAINLDTGADRIYMTGPPASYGGNIQTAPPYMPSMVLGAAAYSSTELDLSSAAVRDRIWDANGDFKNPGENGSLWFGDYGVDIPEYYFVRGVPIEQNGTDTQSWTTGWAGSGGAHSVPGGTRKQYEL